MKMMPHLMLLTCLSASHGLGHWGAWRRPWADRVHCEPACGVLLKRDELRIRSQSMAMIKKRTCSLSMGSRVPTVWEIEAIQEGKQLNSARPSGSIAPSIPTVEPLRWVRKSKNSTSHTFNGWIVKQFSLPTPACKQKHELRRRQGQAAAAHPDQPPLQHPHPHPARNRPLLM